MSPSNKKFGYAVLIGRSNVGKSTLLNALVGTKVSIVSRMAQTTRRPVRGIVSDERGQIVFVDTPGLFLKVPDELTRRVNEEARGALKGVDVILYVADPTREIGREEGVLLQMVRRAEQPKILVINKSDLPERKRAWRHQWEEYEPEFSKVIEVSAIKHTNLAELTDAVFSLLPEGEPMYPEGQFTDLPSEEWVSEIIREKAFYYLGEEIPYKIAVVVDSVEERAARPKSGEPRPEASGRENGMLVIFARILTREPKHKKMIIGTGGRKLNEIGRAARKELEAAMQRKVFLDLKVEVEDWLK